MDSQPEVDLALRAVAVGDDCAIELGPPTTWAHPRRARRVLRFGNAHHSTQSPITTPGSSFRIEAKFAYGLYSKDLVGETVRVFVRTGDCAWAEAAQAVTDGDGRIGAPMPPMEEGLYDYRVVVAGDQTGTHGVIAVLEPQSPVVVFDVDGTLTVSDGELFDEILHGAVPEIAAGAHRVVAHYARQRVQPIYITGRPYHLQRGTIDWLEAMGLPRGPLHTTDSVRDAFPRNAEHYKMEFLEHLSSLGLRVVAAYGNAGSDVCAYAHAGVAAERTFIIGANAGSACEGYPPTQSVENYNSHGLRLAAPLASP